MKDKYTGVELAQTKFAMSASGVYQPKDIYEKHLKQVLNEKIELVTFLNLRKQRSYKSYIYAVADESTLSINPASSNFHDINAYVNALKFTEQYKDSLEALELNFAEALASHFNTTHAIRIYDMFFETTLFNH